jgi:hypothetical protein
MLQAMIIKKVVDVVLKRVLKKYNLGKMKKYVEEPNDADDRIDNLELEVHKLKKDSHPKADWVCLQCGCKARETKKKRKKK